MCKRHLYSKASHFLYVGQKLYFWHEFQWTPEHICNISSPSIPVFCYSIFCRVIGRRCSTKDIFYFSWNLFCDSFHHQSKHCFFFCETNCAVENNVFKSVRQKLCCYKCVNRSLRVSKYIGFLYTLMVQRLEECYRFFEVFWCKLLHSSIAYPLREQVRSIGDSEYFVSKDQFSPCYFWERSHSSWDHSSVWGKSCSVDNRSSFFFFWLQSVVVIVSCLSLFVNIVKVLCFFWERVCEKFFFDICCKRLWGSVSSRVSKVSCVCHRGGKLGLFYSIVVYYLYKWEKCGDFEVDFFDFLCERMGNMSQWILTILDTHLYWILSLSKYLFFFSHTFVAKSIKSFWGNRSFLHDLLP